MAGHASSRAAGPAAAADALGEEIVADDSATTANGQAGALHQKGGAYEPGYIKRRRRTKGQVERLDQQIVDVLEEDHPQSIRHVFYRMTDPRLDEPVPKTDTGSPNGYRMVWHRLKELRRSGKVPYWWITDATRRGYHVPTYANGADFLRAHVAAYRGDLWVHADDYVEVWAESRSIAGVVEDDCEDLAVSLYPAGGFSSITLVHEAAEQIAEQIGESNKPANIIYVGDYDPAGVLIDVSIEAELRRHLPAETDLTFHRIAITEAQIAQYDLPTKPRKPGDKRAPHVKETVEAEAMPAGILRQMLRDKIEFFLPPGALEVIKAAEESERDGLESWAKLMDGGAAHSRSLPTDPAIRTRHRIFRAIEELAGHGWDDTALASDLAKHWPWSSDMLLAPFLLLGNIRDAHKRLSAGAGGEP